MEKFEETARIIEAIEEALKSAGAPAIPYTVITDEMMQAEQMLEITAGLLREGLPLFEAKKKAEEWLTEAMLHRRPVHLSL